MLDILGFVFFIIVVVVVIGLVIVWKMVSVVLGLKGGMEGKNWGERRS